jgi:hypothetical protein
MSKTTASSKAEAIQEITTHFLEKFGASNRELVETHCNKLLDKRRLNPKDLTLTENDIRKALA